MKKIFGFPLAVCKEKSSQIPHVHQPSGDFSSSSMSTNPSLSGGAIGNIIFNIEKAAARSRQMPAGAEI